MLMGSAGPLNHTSGPFSSVKLGPALPQRPLMPPSEGRPLQRFPAFSFPRGTCIFLAHDLLVIPIELYLPGRHLTNPKASLASALAKILYEPLEVDDLLTHHFQSVGSGHDYYLIFLIPQALQLGDIAD